MSVQNSQWVSYLKHQDQKPFITGVDLGLSKRKLSHLYPFVSKITLHGNSERIQENGMPEQEELDKLQAIEDKILNLAQRTKGAIFCGWLTGNGKRELIFYVGKPKQFAKKMEAVLKKKLPIQTETTTEKDEKWTVYFEELYPSAVELEAINKQLLSEEEE